MNQPPVFVELAGLPPSIQEAAAVCFGIIAETFTQSALLDDQQHATLDPSHCYLFGTLLDELDRAHNPATICDQLLLPMGHALGLDDRWRGVVLRSCWRSGFFDQQVARNRTERPPLDNIRRRLAPILEQSPFLQVRRQLLLEQRLCRDEHSVNEVARAFEEAAFQSSLVSQVGSLLHRCSRDGALTLLEHLGVGCAGVLLALEERRDVIEALTDDVPMAMATLRGDLWALHQACTVIAVAACQPHLLFGRWAASRGNGWRHS